MSDHRKNPRGNAVERARALRKDMSIPEVKLWMRLRDRSVVDAKFRRQHRIGPYTADFFCDEVMLVVELDGQMHDPEHDAKRDAYMQGLGMRVLRLPVSYFEKDMGSAMSTIVRVIRELRAAKAAG